MKLNTFSDNSFRFHYEIYVVTSNMKSNFVPVKGQIVGRREAGLISGGIDVGTIE